MNSRGLLGTWNNRFYIGNRDWSIEFDKYNQELFNLLKMINGDIFFTTGPGSFIGTRSIVSFLMGYNLYNTHNIYGFNLLLDLLPFLWNLQSKPMSDKEVVYIYEDINRFFYISRQKDIQNRTFTLLSLVEVEKLINNNNYHIVTNWNRTPGYIDMNFQTIFRAMEQIYSQNTKVYYNYIEYNGTGF